MTTERETGPVRGTGHEGAGHEGTGHEGTGHEGTGHEGTGRSTDVAGGATQQESTQQESTQQESTQQESTQQESLAQLLGGARGAIDATLPVVAYVAGWYLLGRSVPAGGLAALIVAGLVAGWRLSRGARPRAVLVGALAVCASVLIALYTGRAQDFFLIQVFSNAASALAWAVSIVLRWPLLGVVVGTALGQKTRWRRDPGLLRAYGRSSWVWVGQYLTRLSVFLPLWAAGHVAALGVARVALSWPLIAACLAVSWVVLRRSLPSGHPGLRHPVVAEPTAGRAV